MVALASAFVRLRPEVDRNEWRRAGQQAGDQAGRDTGKAYGEGFKRGADGKVRDANGKFVKDATGTGTKAGKGFASEFARNAGRLDAVSDSLGRIGLIGAGAFGLVVKSAADFDKQMSSVAAATHAGTQQIGQLREAALQAGADTAFSATDAARGIEELSKAGVSTASVLGGGLKGALDLAAAGQLDVGEAAETAASAMTQFRLQGGQVPHVADLLAAAAGKAQGSVHDMGFALSQTGLVASQMGLSVEDTTGTLAAFASAGLIGSDAGTSFKTMLLALQNPTSKSADLMKDLGINAYDASGQFVGITNLAGQLQTKLGGLTQAQRDATLAQIFGSDAIRSASILYRQGQSGIQGWIDKTNDAGFAAETARIKTDNLAGDVERLTGSFSTLAIESGGGANSGLRVITKSANALVDQIGQLPSGITATATVLAGVGGVLALGSAGWIKYRKTSAEAHAELAKTGPLGQKASAGLQATTKWAGRATAAFVALEIAGAAVDAAMGDLNPQVDALGMGLGQFAKGGAVSGEAARLLGDDMSKLDTALKDVADTGRWSSFARGFAGSLESVVPGIDHFDDSLTQSRERLKAVDAALAQMAQAGSTQQAAAAFDAIAKRAKDQGVSIGELRAALPAYTATVATAGSASTTAAVGVKAVGDASGDAADMAKEAQTAFEDLFGVFMTSDQAAIAYQNTLASTTKELKEGKHWLDLGSEAGRQNRTAVLNLITAIEDQRSANIDNGLSVADADRKYKTQITSLVKTMTQMGFNKKAIEDLIGKYRDLPKTASTTIKTPGLPTADKGVKDYDKKLDALARQIRTEVNVVGVSPAYAQLKNLLIAQQALKKGISVSAAKSAYGKQEAASGLALGGTVPGWSPTRTADNIPAMLTAREFVQPVDAVDYYGVPFMEAIRKRLVPKDVAAAVASYARGGYVLNAPFLVNAGVTRIPSRAEAMSAVTPAVPRGATLPWIERMVHAAFPGMPLISGFRRGARTLSGNISYHALDRAGDWPASLGLAKYWNARFKAITKEFISPWNRYNILNGAQHSYTGAIYRQHTGTNAHDHIAVGKGGLAGRLAKAANIPVRLFDSGGAWPSGTLGANLSGRTEYVYPDGSGGVSITLVNHGVIGSQGELDAWLARSVKRLRNERKLP